MGSSYPGFPSAVLTRVKKSLHMRRMDKLAILAQAHFFRDLGESSRRALAEIALDDTPAGASSSEAVTAAACSGLRPASIFRQIAVWWQHGI